jgi:glycosyltransferase involved in cell wall biosynthesis
MKILLINKFLFPKGGDAISTIETGKLLTKKGHEVNFWGMEHPLNKEFPFKRFFISYVDYNKKLSIYKQIKNSLKILYSFEAKNKMCNLLAEWKPDIVHLNNIAHQISPSILYVFKKHKIPVVMTMHDYKLVCPSYLMLLNGKPCERCKNGKYYHCFINKCTKNSGAKSLINTLEMYLHHKILKIYNNISYFISPSIFLMEKIKDMGFNGNTVYLPNFVDIEKYEPNYCSKNKDIIYFGRLSKEKGVDTLMSSVKNLDVSVKIIGSGPCEDRFKNRVREELINNVHFLGFKEGKELIDIISNYLFVVVPSEWYENNPRSVLESFAMGKPVIGSRIGGIPELVIDGKTGFTFKPGDKNDLRGKIKNLTGNINLIKELGKNARRLIEEKYSTEKYYDGLMKIYKMAIDLYL